MIHLNVNARPSPAIRPGTIAAAAVAFLLSLAAPAVSLLPALTTGLRGTGAAVSFPHGYPVTVVTTLAVTAAAAAAGALIARRAALVAIPLALVWWALAGLGVTIAGLALGHTGLAGWGAVLLAAAAAGAAAGLPLAARRGRRGPDATAPPGPAVTRTDHYPSSASRNVFRNAALATAAITAVVVAAGTVSIASASQAAQPSAAKPQTLTFDVVFSPFSPVAANNARNPNSPFALGDEIVSHDQLFSGGRHVGDDVFSCVIVSVPPDPALANCTAVFRLPGGNITAQTPATPGPAPKDLALTGGTGTYRNISGDGTLVEFGNGKGKLTLHLLDLRT